MFSLQSLWEFITRKRYSYNNNSDESNHLCGYKTFNPSKLSCWCELLLRNWPTIVLFTAVLVLLLLVIQCRCLLIGWTSSNKQKKFLSEKDLIEDPGLNVRDDDIAPTQVPPLSSERTRLNLYDWIFKYLMLFNSQISNKRHIF